MVPQYFSTPSIKQNPIKKSSFISVFFLVPYCFTKNICYYKAVTVQPQRCEGSKKIMGFRPVSKKEEAIATQIVDAAYTVHKKLGPGLLEKIYEVCFCHELSKRGLKYHY